MNYGNPELLDRLAAEYVLGTLHGAARRRFERLLVEMPDARAAVNRWEIHFADLGQALPPVTPPASVWTAIEERITSETLGSTASFNFWRRWALFSSTALIAAIAFMFFESEEILPPPEQQVAFVNETNATPLWVVSMNFNTGELSTRAVSVEAQDIDKVYELWMLPAQGDPRSLGLMPVSGGHTTQKFSPALLDLLRSASGLAVSIEPAGGSPTGLPTGPVVYQAPMVNI